MGCVDKRRTTASVSDGQDDRAEKKRGRKTLRPYNRYYAGCGSRKSEYKKQKT